MITGKLIRAGTSFLNGEEVTGLFVQVRPDDLRAIKWLPMYQDVTVTPDSETVNLRATLNALLAYAGKGSPQETIIARALGLTPAQLNPPPASHELE